MEKKDRETEKDKQPGPRVKWMCLRGADCPVVVFYCFCCFERVSDRKREKQREGQRKRESVR